ncbi:MAG: hypothetical protein IJC37_02110 [Clostridia bacterium]|nr:hypothetical protein [Clostridia bacterium]
MKLSFKKVISLVLAMIITVSVFTLTVSAADAQAAQSESILMQIVSFLLGEEVFADGGFNFEALLHVLYYKDSPMMMKIYDAAYVAFWDMLISIINLFV